MNRRKRMLNDLDQDIRDHIELETQDNVARGMSPEEARYAALRKFGNVTRVQEETRVVWSSGWLEQLLQDIRLGLRVLPKSPGFTAVAILTLALGIGANTAIFSVINGVLLSPLPYKDPKQLVIIREHESLPNVMDILRQTRAFSQGGGINVEKMDYIGPTEPVHIRVGSINAGFLETLGVQPMLGRIISPGEDVQGGPRLATVSNHFWQNYLCSDPHALGNTIQLGGNSYTVIGVMPASFAPPAEHADVFVSLMARAPRSGAERDLHFMHTYWRLKEGVTLVQAQADMAAIDHRLAEQYPAEEKERKSQLIPLHEWLVGNVRSALLVLFGAVGLVLLIACANFASLLMMRAVAGRQELVIRAGLSGIHMDTRVLLFVLVVSVLTGIVFGMAPAWIAAGADVAEALKKSGRSTTASTMGHSIRKILVTSELAVALVLLVGAGLLIKGFSRLRSMNPGFNSANVMTMYLQLPKTRYGEIPKQTQFRRELLTRLNSLPGVQAAMVTDIPLGGNYVGHHFVIDGRAPVAVGGEPKVQTISVMGDYFHVMQIPLRAGRDFTPLDREEQPLVAVVNEEMVREFLPHENPIGTRIRWAGDTGPPQWMTVIGVVADVKHSGLNQPTDPAVYTPFSQSDEAWRRFMTLAIRARDAAP